MRELSKLWHRFQSFFSELGRRRVYRVAAVYAAVAFVIWQVAEIAFPALRLPEWALTLIVVLSLLGFPIAVTLAWAFELTPEGVRRSRPARVSQALDNGARASETEGARSVAVLSFADMSAEGDQEHFCDGIAEEIIDALAQLAGLQVVSRSSAFAFKVGEHDVREIGKRLGVDVVLEGSVRKVAKRLRITAQLINVADGYHLWSQRYDRELQDVFEIQDEIARAIADKLRGDLFIGHNGPSVRRHTSDLEAYNLYLRARYAWNRREQGLFKARQHFEEAITRDHRYALAYAGMADCYSLLGFYGFLSPQDSYPAAKASAAKAIEFDPSLAEGHTSLAFAAMCYDWDWSESERKFLRAIELNPGYPTTRHWYSEYLMATGRLQDAISEARRALALDPLGLIINTVVGMALFLARRYHEAEKELKKVHDMDPDFVAAYVWLGLCYVQMGRAREAVNLYDRGRTLSGDRPFLTALMGYALAADSDTTGAEEVLSWLQTESARCYVSPFGSARIHLALGRTAEAIEALEHAYADRSTWLVWSKVDPVLDPLRGAPRFEQLLSRMKFPEPQ